MADRYKDEAWLREQYVENERDGTDIAEECDVTHGTIYYYLDKFDIDKRTRGFKSGEDHPNYSDAKEEYECPVCGDTFMKRPSDVQDTTHGPYCSRDCMYSARSEQMEDNDISMTGEDHPLYNIDPEEHPMYGVRGEDHPNWKGGYGQDFRDKAEWTHTRNEAIDRDRHKCADCDMKRADHYDEFDRDLEVHHITPVSEGGDKYDLNNLVTLCLPCHIDRHRD